MTRSKPFRETETHSMALARQRRNAWMGLYSTADRVANAKHLRERTFALERMRIYLRKLGEMGIEPTPEEP